MRSILVSSSITPSVSLSDLSIDVVQGDEAQRLPVQAQPGLGTVALPLDPFAGLVEGHPAADARAVHVQTEAPRLHRMVALDVRAGAAGPSERNARGENMGLSPFISV